MVIDIGLSCNGDPSVFCLKLSTSKKSSPKLMTPTSSNGSKSPCGTDDLRDVKGLLELDAPNPSSVVEPKISMESLAPEVEEWTSSNRFGEISKALKDFGLRSMLEEHPEFLDLSPLFLEGGSVKLSNDEPRFRAD